MKFVKFGLLSVAAALSFSANAGDFLFKAGDQTTETKICIAAAENNLKQYRDTVKKLSVQTPMRVKNNIAVANGLKCNQDDIAVFARKYGANDTAAHISRYLTRNVSIRRDVVEVNMPEKATLPQVIVVTAN